MSAAGTHRVERESIVPPNPSARLPAQTSPTAPPSTRDSCFPALGPSPATPVPATARTSGGRRALAQAPPLHPPLPQAPDRSDAASSSAAPSRHLPRPWSVPPPSHPPGDPRCKPVHSAPSSRMNTTSPCRHSYRSPQAITLGRHAKRSKRRSSIGWGCPLSAACGGRLPQIACSALRALRALRGRTETEKGGREGESACTHPRGIGPDARAYVRERKRENKPMAACAVLPRDLG
jgi:hypothetical protein